MKHVLLRMTLSALPLIVFAAACTDDRPEVPDDSVCDTDPSQAICASDARGVFVDPNAEPGGDGTKAKPYAAISDALADTSGKRDVFLCAAIYDETVAIAVSRRLVGGFGCARWDNTEERALIQPAQPDGVATVMVSGSQPVELWNLYVQAPTLTEPGASSIAILTDRTPLTLNGVTATAAAGIAGVMGDSPSVIGESGVLGANGQEGGCSPTFGPQQTGGFGTFTPGCFDSVGGNGGGHVSPSSFGEDGTAGLVGPDNHGSAATSEANGCTNGGSGADGMVGSPGPGGVATDAVLTSSGYVGAPGQPGEPGTFGQGGGGGGSFLTQGAFQCVNQERLTPGGGAGGTGGCGGGFGEGGQPGGASIAVTVISAELTITASDLRTSDGGLGGPGGTGQVGGDGGNGGDGAIVEGFPSFFSCDGGKGGSGGRGGPGGGGAGGPSIGIAFIGALEPIVTDVTYSLGRGGDGGFSDGPGTGDHGDEFEVFEMATN